MPDIPTMLSGGDRRSVGRSAEAAKLASQDPRIFRQLIRALWHSDAIIRMRAADAAEKASAQNPKLLAPFKREFLGLLSESDQQEVRWHLAQIIPRLDLSRDERHRVAAVLRDYLGDRSSITRTFAMQALADLAEQDASLRADTLDTIRNLTRSGTPAMRARGRKLLARLERLETNNR